MKIRRFNRSLQEAFTVVEMLVVVVMIGLLGSATIVMYSFWQDDTDKTVAEADLRGASSAMKQYKNSNGTYPSSISSTDFKASNGSSLTVSYADRVSFCVQSVLGSGAEYRMTSDDTDPQPGSCIAPSNSLEPPVVKSVSFANCWYAIYSTTPVMWPTVVLDLEPSSKVTSYRFYNNGILFSGGNKPNPNTSSNVKTNHAFSDGQIALTLAEGENDISVTVRAVSSSGALSEPSQPWKYKFNAVSSHTCSY